MTVGDKKQNAPKALLSAPVVLDGRAIPAWGMVLTQDLLSDEVRGLSAVSLRCWLCLIAVAGGNATGWNCSVKHLVSMVGASDRQVYRAFSDLEAAGLLRRHRTGRTTRYELVSVGQLARVGKTPDTTDMQGGGSIPDRTVRSELPSLVRSELTPVSGNMAENQASNRKLDDLQRDLTERSNTTPPNPPTGGGGEGDMTDKSPKDAVQSRERSSVDTVKRTRGIPPLQTTASGRLLKRWIDGRLAGLAPSAFEAERDLVEYQVESNGEPVVLVLVQGLGVSTRRAACRLQENKRSALAYIADLKPDPYDAQLEIRELQERIDKAGLKDQASRCETEADVSELLHALVMRECGY